MDKVKRFFQNKKVINICTYLAIIIISFIVYFTQLLQDKNLTNTKELIFVGLFAIISIIIGLLMILSHKKDIKPERLFLVTAIILELIYMFATPLFKGHDEQYIWYRSYEVSKGIISTTQGDEYRGSQLPAEVSDIYGKYGNFEVKNYKTARDTWEYSIENRHNEELKYEYFTNTSPTSAYSPLQVLPQAIGIKLARFCRLDVYSQGMVGRLFNVLFFVIGGYFAIKLIPKKKGLIFLLLMTPKIMYISGTLSSDVIINTTVLLFISYIMKLREQKETVKWTSVLFLSLLVPFIAASKFVYIPLCFLPIIIPKSKFKKGNITKALLVGWIIALAAGSFMVWKTVGNVDLATANSAQVGTGQTEFLIHHPVSFLGMLFRSVFDNFSFWALDTVGGYMEWGVALINPELISVIVYAILILSILSEEKFGEKFKKTDYIYSILMVLASFAAIITAMYIACVKEIGATYIDGVQGRYIIPLLPLVFLLIPTKNKKEIKFNYLYMAMIMCHIPTLLNIIVRNLSW